MWSTSGYASIRCIFFHQLQPSDMMAPITRGVPNGFMEMNEVLVLFCIYVTTVDPFFKPQFDIL